MGNRIQHKLLRYEADPPSGTWDEISRRLDEMTSVFPQKLYNYEQAPAHDLWPLISSQLRTPARGKLVSINKRIPLTTKYAALAVFSIAIVVALTLFVGKPTVSGGSGINLQAAKNSTPANSRQAEMQPSIKKLTGSEQKLSVVPASSPPKAKFIFIRPLGNYMLFSDDGNIRRLSKKLVPTFASANTDSNSARKIKAMQYRASAGTITTGFSGLLEILQHLGENQ